MINKAILEGIKSFSIALCSSTKSAAALENFMSMQHKFADLLKTTGNDLNQISATRKILIANFEIARLGLQETLKIADTNTIDYKCFSYLIQLLWEYLNPKLNPCFYDELTSEQSLLGLLATFGFIKIPNQSYNDTFLLGENVGTTAGAVIFENEVLQLLYFAPKTRQKKHIPIFIIPPWINKYYIFDLNEEKSFIKWLLDKGISVYCISWVNPDRSFSKLGLHDYVVNGIGKSSQKARAHCHTDTLNYIGYCIGGVALTIYLASFQYRERPNAQSVTFLATPFDFTKLDNLNLFISDEQLPLIENVISHKGLFSNEDMNHIFTMMRAKDLVFQEIINQIYLNKPRNPMDFLYWNADTTHLPGKMHLDYLRDVFLKNAFLTQQKRITTIDVDFTPTRTPTFILGTTNDHIVPWQSSYEGLSLFIDSHFSLAGGGHVSGIINHPLQNKYGFSIAETPMSTKTTAEGFSASSVKHEGSWWSYWANWIDLHLGKNVPNKKENYAVIELTPGRYAKQKAPLIESLSSSDDSVLACQNCLEGS